MRSTWSRHSTVAPFLLLSASISLPLSLGCLANGLSPTHSYRALRSPSTISLKAILEFRIAMTSRFTDLFVTLTALLNTSFHRPRALDIRLSLSVSTPICRSHIPFDFGL